MDDLLNEVLKDLLASINDVEECYYYKMSDFYDATSFLEPGMDQENLIQELPKHAERLFAYELYFYLRWRIKVKEQLYGKIKLTGELRKEKLPKEIYNKFKLTALSKRFIPDFLIHIPQNIDRQLAVIELKTDPNIDMNELFYDLEKIDEFIERYNYEIGIFIAINVRFDKISNLIRQRLHRKILNLHRIFVVVKESKGSSLISSTLFEIIH